MNRRRALQAVAALALPVADQLPATPMQASVEQFAQESIGPQGAVGSAGTLIRPAPVIPVDWIARYLAVYGPALQGPTGACHACVATVAQQAVSLNVQNAPGPPLSWPYAYLQTGDTTFRPGSNALITAALRMNGTCTDALYSQDFVLNNWQHGFPYPPELLPSPQAHADAANHRLMQWEHIAYGAPLGQPPDLDRINQYLLAGYPITFGHGSHAGCLMRVETDRYWYAGFDPLQATDVYGLGRGVRPYTADGLYAGGTNFVVYLEVFNAGTAPPPSQAALLAQIRADAAALTDPPTQPQIDALRAHIDLLRVAP